MQGTTGYIARKCGEIAKGLGKLEGLSNMSVSDADRRV